MTWTSFRPISELALSCSLVLSAIFPAGASAAAVALTIEPPSLRDGEATLRTSAPPGTYCRLLESQDLRDWRIFQNRVAGTNGAAFTIPTSDAGYLFYRVELVSVVPLDAMVWIEPGDSMISSPPNEVGRFLDKEDPQTEVILTRGYWLSRFEVTQEEFESVMGFNPSLFKGDSKRPVERVTWFQAVQYCTRLTEREREAGRLPETFAYRLPTEAEWSHAARAGTTTRFSYGDDPDYTELGDYAWYGENSGLRSHPVGLKLPNPWGLFDLHGNVFEWCSDWFGPLPGGVVTDPPGPDEGIDRIIRGGYWDSVPAFCRTAMRVHYPPSSQISYLGFRIALSQVTALR